jgi:hypothetical protein
MSTASPIKIIMAVCLNRPGADCPMVFSRYCQPTSTKKYATSILHASQALLYILSGLAIISLISVVPISLLSAPSMGIEGYQSYGNNLTWFADKADGILPTVSVLSISIWFYKAIMLMWVIWLSTSLLAWIKWAWKTMGTNGYWKSQLSEKLKVEKQPPLQE